MAAAPRGVGRMGQRLRPVGDSGSRMAGLVLAVGQLYVQPRLQLGHVGGWAPQVPSKFAQP